MKWKWTSNMVSQFDVGKDVNRKWKRNISTLSAAETSSNSSAQSKDARVDAYFEFEYESKSRKFAPAHELRVSSTFSTTNQ